MQQERLPASSIDRWLSVLRLLRAPRLTVRSKHRPLRTTLARTFNLNVDRLTGRQSRQPGKRFLCGGLVALTWVNNSSSGRLDSTPPAFTAFFKTPPAVTVSPITHNHLTLAEETYKQWRKVTLHISGQLRALSCLGLPQKVVGDP